jgi:hypothetical protein
MLMNSKDKTHWVYVLCVIIICMPTMVSQSVVHEKINEHDAMESEYQELRSKCQETPCSGYVWQFYPMDAGYSCVELCIWGDGYIDINLMFWNKR